MSDYLVFGANGQVGSALGTLIEDAIVLSREEANFEDPESLREVVKNIHPKAILNAVAYTQVDKAEEDQERARLINAESPRILAEIAKELDIPFVHYSTDYVFDGGGTNARKEDEPTGPLGVYGQTKLEGERAIEAVGGKYLIFRTSWVYDAYGKNFLNTMLRLGADREALKIVGDQIGAPSYAPHLAKYTMETLGKAEVASSFPSGIYHMANGGETSWHGFAEAIFKAAREGKMDLRVTSVESIPSEAYPTPAARPKNSRLDMQKLQETFGITMPHWEEGLKEAMQIKTFPD